MFHPTVSDTGRIVFYPLIKFGEWMGEKHPITWTKIRYFARFHKMPDLKNPKDLNEKILYLKLFTDTSAWTELADKYRVRDYVESCGLGAYLINLVGMWKKVEDIDFEALPDTFIFKANNGCGKNSNLIVRDKKNLDVESAKKTLQGWLDDKHVGALGAEPQYKDIEPCIIAEELLPSEEGQKSPIDYKIWCFNGKAHFIRTYSDRDKNGADAMTYDTTWTPKPEVCISNSRYKQDVILPKPKNLDEMIRVAETLTKPFPCVRLDLYNIHGKVYFGEMTFTSNGGMMNNLTPEFLLKCGEMIDLNYNNHVVSNLSNL